MIRFGRSHIRHSRIAVAALAGVLLVGAAGPIVPSVAPAPLAPAPAQAAELTGAFADYIFPYSSTHPLTAADIQPCSAYTLYLARNEIYARHGYIFNNSDLRAYFGQRSWYVGKYTADTWNEGVLSQVENDNIQVILNRERSMGSPYLGTVPDGSLSDAYVFAQSSYVLLSSDLINNCSAYTLYLARNEIYARHGYIFSNADLATYFSGKRWYKPLYTEANFNNGLLNAVENSNVQAILDREHAIGSPYTGATVVPASTATGGYVVPGSDTRLISDADLSGLTAWGLFVARNEIYARHGYIFQTPSLAQHFGAQGWYVPRFTSDNFDEGSLNATERANIQTIRDREAAIGSPGSNIANDGSLTTLWTDDYSAITPAPVTISRVVTDYFTWDIPSAWADKVSLSYGGTDSAYLRVTLKDYPGMELVRFAIVDASQPLNSGDPSNSLIGYLTNGYKRVELWGVNHVLASCYAATSHSPLVYYPDAACQSEAVALSTNYAYDVYSASGLDVATATMAGNSYYQTAVFPGVRLR